MKTIKIIILALLAIVLGANSYAQSNVSSKIVATKTETLKVSGNCDLCKARIEKAAKIDGVSKAEWDTKSKVLSVTFDPAKTNIDQISKKVAAAGHDNNKVKADKKAIPGDYVTNLNASTPEVSSKASFRISVRTSMLWGWVGILIIFMALGCVFYLFRKYGRR